MNKLQLTVLTSLAVSVSACMSTSSSSSSGTGTGTCESGAQSLQRLVGMDAGSAFEEVDKMPQGIKDITIYAGSSEMPNMLPKGMIVLGHDTPNAVDAAIKGGKVVKVYCNK